MNQVVSIRQLNHFYQEGKKQKQILFDVNFEIQSEDVIILTGESGSGKTTLLSLIGCLRSVQDGSLKVLGQELRAAGELERMQIRRRIGYVFQKFNLLEFMTVRQNVMVSLEMQPEFDPEQAIARSEEILRAVGLGNHLHLYPRDLSGGQQQRVAIARALVHKPPLLLADEPTSSLDRRTGREVIELITALAREQGSAVLIVTHDSRVFSITNQIVRMEDGMLDVDYQERLSVALPTLSDRQLIDLIPQLKILAFPPGGVVIRQGDLADTFYILLEGSVEVVQEQPDGASTVVKTLGPNSYFGEVGLLYETVRTATVRATAAAPIKVIAIGRTQFQKMVLTSDMTHAVLNQHAARLLAMNLRQFVATEGTVTPASKLVLKQFAPGEPIIEPGSPLRELYIVVDGAATMQDVSASAPALLKTFQTSDYFGGIDLLQKRTSAYRICADQQRGAQLMVIDATAFQTLCIKSNLDKVDILSS